MNGTAARYRSKALVAASLAIAAGTALRLHLFLANRPLWLDEAWMALRVLSDGFQENSAIQAASLPFLLLERCAVQFFGHNGFALRALPLVAGIGTVLLVWKIAVRVLDVWGAVLATALVALAPILIRYSAEVKPYGLDALFAVAMIWVTLEVLAVSDKRNWIRWVAIGSLTVLTSIPGVFLVLGASLALLFDRSFSARPESRTVALVSMLGWTALFALVYVVQYRTTASSGFMQAYWARDFLEPHFPEVMGAALRAGKQLFAESLFAPAVRPALPSKTMYLVLLLAAMGFVTLARRQRALIVLLLAPAVFAAAASLLGHWPMVPRLMLFAVPPALLMVAAGVSTAAALLSSIWGHGGRVISGALALVTITPGLLGATLGTIDPRPGWDVVAAIELVREKAGPDATIYVGAFAYVSCKFYSWEPNGASDAQACPIGSARTIGGTFRPTRGIAGAALEHMEEAWASKEVALFAGLQGNVWFVFVGPRRLPQLRLSGVRGVTIPLFLSALEEGGAELQERWRLDGAEVYKYELKHYPNKRF